MAGTAIHLPAADGLRLSNPADEEKELLQYPAKWHMLFQFCLVTITTEIFWLVFAPLPDNVQNYFEIDSSLLVDLLSIVYIAMYIPGTFFSIYLYDIYQLRGVVVMSCWFMVIGGWIRFCACFFQNSNVAFYVVLAGQAIAGVSQPLILNASVAIANCWFGAKERDMAATIAILCNIVGNAFGQIWPTLFTSTDVNNVSTVNMKDLLLSQAAWCTVMSLYVYFCFKGKPPTPPSISQEQAPERKLVKFGNLRGLRLMWREIVFCVRVPSYPSLMIGFGLVFAVFQSLVTSISAMISPAGYSNSDITVIEASFTGGALVGSLIAGYFLDKFHAYTAQLRIQGSLAAVFTVGFLILINTRNNLAAVMASSVLMGCFLIGSLPVALVMASEYTYPISEVTSTGLILSFGMMMSIPFIFISQVLVGTAQPISLFPWNSIFFSGVMVVAAIFLLILRGKYQRLANEMYTDLEKGGRLTASSFGLSPLSDNNGSPITFYTTRGSHALDRSQMRGPEMESMVLRLSAGRESIPRTARVSL